MACGCPVVSTEVGGPRDTLKPGLNGYLANLGDAEALARYLVKVTSMPDEDWRAMSERATLTAGQYSWDKSVAHFEAALFRRTP
jgi:glycosyltransferase involved in cell wall biosynthesis